MLSIEDVFSEDAVCAWIDKVHAIHPDCTFSVETKIDGLSMSLRYVKEADGKLHLQLAETRGDGLIGEDVTANARVVGDVLQVIDLPYDSLELRGEVYMSHEDFEKYNEEQERLEKKTAANPRNLAAGTLRQLDTSITKKRGLKMFIFSQALLITTWSCVHCETHHNRFLFSSGIHSSHEIASDSQIHSFFLLRSCAHKTDVLHPISAYPAED